MTEMAVNLGVCQVRSGTDDPCTVPATVLLFGVPFCELHAREQERYFEIGDLTGEREPLAYRDSEAFARGGRLFTGMLERLRSLWLNARGL